MLVTLEMARNHLRIDGADDDDWLATWIPAASDVVLLWLKDDWRAYELEVDSNGDVVVDSSGNPVPAYDSNGPIVRPAVQAAVLVELGVMYRYRDGDGPQQPTIGYGYVLCPRATSLLAALRKPTLSA